MRLAAFIIASLLASAPTLGAEQAAQTPEQAKQQLAAAQSAIDEVQTWLLKANAQQSNEEKRLQNAVVALAKSARELEGLAEQRRSLEGKLDELQRLISGQESALAARARTRRRDAGVTQTGRHEPRTRLSLRPRAYECSPAAQLSQPYNSHAAGNAHLV